MGLLGPSWDWEEIQKKDAIMGELKKENDRVLKERRKENDRVINKLNNSNVSNRSDHSLTADDYKFLHDLSEKEHKEFEREKLAVIASKNYSQMISCFWGDICFLLFSIFLLIMTRNIFILFIIFLIPIIAFLLTNVKDYILLIKGACSIRTIKKARCYQDILNDIKKLNLDEIKYIEIYSYAICVADFKNNITEYKYESYNFPPLPTEKHAIFLGSLIYDLGLNKKLLISAKGNLKAENLKLIAKMEKDNKKKERQEKKEKERKINKGETW